MNNYKKIKKKMIDKDITWSMLVEKSKLYKSSWGLRAAIQNDRKKAIEEVEKILNDI